MKQLSKMMRTNPVPAGSGRGSNAPDKALYLILESIGEGVHGIDQDGRITFVNSTAARMLGWSIEELIGKRQHALIHHSRGDGSPFPEETCAILGAIRDGRVHHRSDEVFWRKDGTRFPVDYIATPLREGAAIIGAVVAFRDISEQRVTALQLAREQELQRVLMQVPAAIAITRGPQHTIESANLLYKRLAGNRELVGKTAREAFPEIEGQIYGIMSHVVDVTDMVQAREVAEAKHQDGCCNIGGPLD